MCRGRNGQEGKSPDTCPSGLAGGESNPGNSNEGPTRLEHRKAPAPFSTLRFPAHTWKTSDVKLNRCWENAEQIYKKGKQKRSRAVVFV